jgi:hypothetical protein
MAETRYSSAGGGDGGHRERLPKGTAVSENEVRQGPAEVLSESNQEFEEKERLMSK